jgi:phosphoribosylaminoimidazole-succinocarboxamide synthase
MPVSSDVLAAAAAPGRTLFDLDADFAALGERYSGKVRENYTRGHERTIVVTDRISAFDVVLGTIPFKGQVLNGLALHWFSLTSDVFPNHLVDVPDPQVMRVVECIPIPVEFVVRGYLTGVSSTSIWRAYERGDRTFCGHALPDGLRKHEKLPANLLTPSTKAAKGAHDESVSRDQLVAMGAIDRAEFDRLETRCLELFAFGQRAAAERGMILVDTKYELGRRPDGEIVLIDEIHTPDSSRYWYMDGYAQAMAQGQDPKSLDKEYVRRWLVGEGYHGDGPPPTLPDDVRVEAARRYIETYERLTGRAFIPDTQAPLARIKRALGLSD